MSIFHNDIEAKKKPGKQWSLGIIYAKPSGDCLTATSGSAKNCGLEGTYLVLGPIFPLDSTYAKSHIKLPMDQADEVSL